MAPHHGLYRWHLPDPVYFGEDLRVTLQQIGQVGTGLFERSDDVSSVAYWYQDGGSVAAPRSLPGRTRTPLNTAGPTEHGGTSRARRDQRKNREPKNLRPPPGSIGTEISGSGTILIPVW
ncbi:DUF2961 domain-containing protein [Streptomyces sp. M19]